MSKKANRARGRLPYRIELTDQAREELASLSQKIRRQIGRKIDALVGNPRPPWSKKLKGVPNLYSVRSGDYRVLYQVKDEDLLVLVVRVRHRGDVYRGLPREKGKQIP